MWTENNYRRLFLDMHIDDSKEEYYSKLDPDAIFNTLLTTGTQMITVKGITHTGLANYPSQTGRTHRGLRGVDYVGRMVELAHAHGIAVMGYFSQTFDNWAYEHHPAWRQVNAEGKCSRDYEDYHNHSIFRRGRYGIVCPNNPEYREHVKLCLTEMNTRYKFDSIFLDMPFWSEICHCAACKERYYRETGRELPKTVDFDDPVFLDFVQRRYAWMAEFTALSVAAVKAANPDCTCELNVGGAPCSSWVGAMSDTIADQGEYVGGDLYGGYMEESFICKYSRNLSNTLPFVYHTSRCDPDLQAHTTIRMEEEFVTYGIIALVHKGAFCICDGINPDGTLCVAGYQRIGKAFRELEKYACYVNGDYVSNAAVWVPSFSKFDRAQNGTALGDTFIWGYHEFLDTKVRMARILRDNHIPFDVLPSKKLKDYRGDVLIASGVAQITDAEMEDLEAYLKSGGNLYLTGRPGHPRLLELMEAEYIGQTDEDVTYMAPTEVGKPFFGDFTVQDPMSVLSTQAKLVFHGQTQVLAKLVLPYTMTDRREFSSIHSNPPGVHTEFVSMAVKQVGKGRIFWAAAPIEKSQSYMIRQVTASIIRSLCGTYKFTVDAPSYVEVVSWDKDQRHYFAVLNEMDLLPPAPMSKVDITVPYTIRSARIVGSQVPVQLCADGGRTVLHIPEGHLFHIIEAE